MVFKGLWKIRIWWRRWRKRRRVAPPGKVYEYTYDVRIRAEYKGKKGGKSRAGAIAAIVKSPRRLRHSEIVYMTLKELRGRDTWLDYVPASATLDYVHEKRREISPEEELGGPYVEFLDFEDLKGW